ncbi:MAG: siderophore-interacting protein [Lacisediminihabitans sp.]
MTLQEAAVPTTPQPEAPSSVWLMTVARTARPSSSFVRITLTTDDARFAQTFEALGHDQWFRLFMPIDGVLELPYGDAEGWYSRWLEMDERVRGVIRNYTVREARRVEAGWELDVDFVVHRSPLDSSGRGGEVEGVAAQWALGAQPGDTAGFLAQACIFDPDNGASHVVVIADESGVPAAEGISASLASDVRSTFVLEVPHGDDPRSLATDDRSTLHWLVRDDDALQPGSVILEHLDGIELPTESYIYIVGEAAFVLAARASLLGRGIPKAQIRTCAYWRRGRRPGRIGG